MDYQWKYRVVKRPHREPHHSTATIVFAIYEVYRDENDKIVTIAARAEFPTGDTAAELKADIGAMLEAFQLPVFDYGQIIEEIAQAKSTTGKLHDV